MGNQDIPIETATEILFDKKMFYKLIGEWNDEYNHPEHFFGDKGPYRYDKYDLPIRKEKLKAYLLSRGYTYSEIAFLF